MIMLYFMPFNRTRLATRCSITLTVLPHFVTLAFGEEPAHVYSTGLRARLGFSSGLMNCSQVILTDETLSIGGKHSRDKASASRERALVGDRAMALVSHYDHHALRLCTQAGLPERRPIMSEEGPADVLAEYSSLLTEQTCSEN